MIILTFFKAKKIPNIWSNRWTSQKISHFRYFLDRKASTKLECGGKLKYVISIQLLILWLNRKKEFKYGLLEVKFYTLTTLSFMTASIEVFFEIWKHNKKYNLAQLNNISKAIKLKITFNYQIIQQVLITIWNIKTQSEYWIRDKIQNRV